MGILTVGVVTKPFHFEGGRRMKVAETGITDLQKAVDTLIIIPNQNLFRVANEKTTFADAFAMADQVLYSGVACITDLMVKEGLINLDFADVRSIMSEMGKAMMGTGEATGEKRAVLAAEAAIANPLLDETSMKGARGLLISITGGNDLTLYEVDEAASRIRQEVDEEANIILGATFDSALDGVVRVSVVATGIDQVAISQIEPVHVYSRPEPVPRSRPAPASGRYAPAPAMIEPAQFAAVVGDVEIQPVAPVAVAFPEPIEPRRQVPDEEASDFISARARTAYGSRSAHAADRRPAAGGADPVARGPWRGAAGLPRRSRSSAQVFAREAGGLRHHTARRRAGPGSPRSSGPSKELYGPGSPAGFRPDTAAAAAGSPAACSGRKPRRTWPTHAPASGDRGRPPRHPGVSAAATELISGEAQRTGGDKKPLPVRFLANETLISLPIGLKLNGK